jgi:hypothetical protein
MARKLEVGLKFNFQVVVFASKAVPRIMVREDFPEGVSSKLEMVASTLE